MSSSLYCNCLFFLFKFRSNSGSLEIKESNDSNEKIISQLSLGIKEFYDKYANVEMEIEETEGSINKILEEIEEIASCEEKYRDIITKLKAKYRFLEKEFNDKESLLDDLKDTIKMQFENIEKRFSDFDIIMEEKLYNEIR